MTTQFSQLVSYTFLLRMAPDNSYFILCPRSVSVQNNKCLTFGGYGSFSDFDSIVPHYSPSYPVNFQQFGASWCEESIRAYFNFLGIGSYINSIQFEGIRFVENGNRSSASGINSSILLCNLLLNNQIDTDFDNLFSDLITQISSSAVSIATQIADSNTNLLSVITNLTNLNNNLGNINTSLNNLNIDIGDVDIQTDNLVTQLQNIYTILSSQNANMSAINSTINNKDNQSNIVDELRYIFTQSSGQDSHRIVDREYNLSVFKGNYSSSSLNNLQRLDFAGFRSVLQKISNKLSKVNDSFNNSSSIDLGNKLLYGISQDIYNIETKLEQNLPFVTNVYPLVETNVDFPYEVKILNKDNCSDNKKNDI